jgi:hypothetical protein
MYFCDRSIDLFAFLRFHGWILELFRQWYSLFSILLSIIKDIIEISDDTIIVQITESRTDRT